METHRTRRPRASSSPIGSRSQGVRRTMAMNEQEEPTKIPGRIGIPPTSSRAPAAIEGEIDFVSWGMERVLADLQRDDWLIKDRLEFGGVTLLAASPKAGKATPGMALFAAIARGDGFFRPAVPPVPSPP